MGYSLEHDEPVLDGIRRVCGEQVDDAIAALGDGFTDDPHVAIHEVRKHCKKIRGAVRLVRPVVHSKRYRAVNELARDAARELSDFRDARALTGTFERLRDVVEFDADQMAATHDVLVADQTAAEEAITPENSSVVRSRELLVELRDAVDRLRATDTDWDAISPGLVKTYERGRVAMATCIDRPTGESFHEWRKRAKYTRYHLGLITPSAPDLLDALEQTFHQLTDALGDAHDLFVIEQRLDDVDGIDGTRLLIAGARADLERRAVRLGRRLYAESGKRFEQRLGTYWDAWRSEPVDAAAGGLGSVSG